jgi:hypothetical protein
MVPSTARKALSGSTLCIRSISCFWKLSIGIYGIRVNMKIIAGKIARIKLNAMAEALVVIAPSTTLFQKNKVTS